MWERHTRTETKGDDSEEEEIEDEAHDREEGDEEEGCEEEHAEYVMGIEQSTIAKFEINFYQIIFLVFFYSFC